MNRIQHSSSQRTRNDQPKNPFSPGQQSTQNTNSQTNPRCSVVFWIFLTSIEQTAYLHITALGKANLVQLLVFDNDNVHSMGDKLLSERHRFRFTWWSPRRENRLQCSCNPEHVRGGSGTHLGENPILRTSPRLPLSTLAKPAPSYQNIPWIEADHVNKGEVFRGSKLEQALKLVWVIAQLGSSITLYNLRQDCSQTQTTCVNVQLTGNIFGKVT